MKKLYKFSELAELCYGKNQHTVAVESSDIPILGTGGIIGYSSKALYTGESVLIGRKGTIDKPSYINRPFWTIDTLFYTKINKKLVIPRYFYYFVSTLNLMSYVEGAAVPSLTTKALNDIDCLIDDMDMQRHIVGTIGTIDDLIENLANRSALLEREADLIYRKDQFVSGVSVKLGDVCKIKTGKLDANKSKANGKYKFFTCGKEELRIDDFAFSGESIIIAGNGDISVKFYDGRFNAYQRTYVLQPKEYFYLFLEEAKHQVNRLLNESQGSVIKFLTKGMLSTININVSSASNCTNERLKSLYSQATKLNRQREFLQNEKRLLLSKYF